MIYDIRFSRHVSALEAVAAGFDHREGGLLGENDLRLAI